MNQAIRRRLALLDVVGISLLLPLYIWHLSAYAYAWVLFPVWLSGSFLLQRDTPKSLGWRADNLGAATREALLPFAVLMGALAVIGLLLGTLTAFPPHLLSPRRLGSYFAFCLLQQVALQSLLNNRLLKLTGRPEIASLLAGAIFAAAHWPNPVLVPVTLVGGTLMCWLFARQRNVIPLAVGQALLGSLAWACFPVEWHHHLRVGPGYYRAV